MKTIKVIDLLNMIANRGEVPKKIRFNNIEWNKVYGEKNVYYINEYDSDFFLYFFRKNLDFTLNDEVEILEEEKKIPEKLEQIMTKRGKYNSVNDLAEEISIAFETIDDLIINQNQVIDYLKRKGE